MPRVNAPAAAPSPLPAVAAGLLAAFVGYASSVTVVIQGLIAVGASPPQIASALLALGFAMGLPALWFSLRLRQPISIAWSTPGAALLAGSGALGADFAEAVGAFLAVAVLIAAAGLSPTLARLVSRIPTAVANALLAGVIFQLCLSPFRAIEALPTIALPVVALWALVGRFNRYLAVPAAIALAAALLAAGESAPAIDWRHALPAPLWVTPQFTWQAMVSIALPLFLVTMASQNVTGLAVLKAFGYRPPLRPLLLGTGFASLLAAPFGALTVNLAAITAALCAGDDAHPDPARRWIAGAVSGLGYIVFGGMAGAATALVLAAPPLMIQAIAGLALLGALGGSLKAAVVDEAERPAALIAFVTTASGLTFVGIGSAFWGLLAGLAMLGLGRLRFSR